MLSSLCALTVLGNHKTDKISEIVDKMLKCFQAMMCNMSLKIYFPDSHPEFFPQNMGEVSVEHSERFHQDIAIMGKRFVGRWNWGIPVDSCWSVVRQHQRVAAEERDEVRNLRVVHV